jgi:SpoVK/Ycf46/Vps4 family AAA+-type ATPase
MNQWTGKDSNLWHPVGNTAPLLEPGYYKVKCPTDFTPFGFAQETLNHDNIIVTGLAKRVISDINKFLAAKARYTKFGFLHKRGVLMTGIPGTGKTLTAILIANRVIQAGGIAVVPPDFDGEHEPIQMFTRGIRLIRAMHPSMPILTIIEDVENFSRDLEYLLDGENQVDNIVHIAITNHPEKLDAKLLNRPGRFDDVIYVEAPDAETRAEYLTKTLPADTDPALCAEIVRVTDGMLLSHMREIVNAHFILERSLESAVASIKEMMARSDENDAAKNKINLPPAFLRVLGIAA